MSGSYSWNIYTRFSPTQDSENISDKEAEKNVRAREWKEL